MFGRPLRAGFRAAPMGGRGPIRTARSSAMPSWWRSATVGQWYSISGTAGPSSATTGLKPDAYGDMTLRPSDSTLFFVANGGHSDSASNAAASIRLSDDAPSFTTLRASSWNGSETNVTYYADGSPASRHTYHFTHYIESLDAVLLAGCRFAYGGSTPVGPGMDLFDLATSQYLPQNTWPDIPSFAGYYGVVQDGNGDIWLANGKKFDVSAETWSTPGTGALLRFPAAYDSTRNKLVALQFDDGQGPFGGGMQCVQLDPTTGNSQTITFNSSAAVTAFIAAAPYYAGLAFCPLDGKLYFADPQNLNTLYVITPNSGTTWDMETLSVGGHTFSAGTYLGKRFLWVEALSGFVVQSSQAETLKFLRMA